MAAFGGRFPAPPFGASWEDLKLRDLRAFFRGRPTERSIWEAKQQDSKAKIAQFVRKEVCAFANRRGGYLVLGAEEHERDWKLAGIEIRGVAELHDWIASLLRSLTPEPLFDIHEWGLSTGRRVVVVQVEEAPVPPVATDGIVYLRHGTQSIRAPGSAIRRLAEEGRRAQRPIEKSASALATELGSQLWVPFAVAIGRHGARKNQLGDTAPADALSNNLRSVLAGRWRSRKLVERSWGESGEMEDEAKKIGLEWSPKPLAPFVGWRSAVEVIQEAPGLRPPIRQRLHRRHEKDALRSVDPNLGDRDYWVAQLRPPNNAAGFKWPHPVGRHTPYWHRGSRAIGDAALLLRGLIRAELQLGATPSELAFVCLALKDLRTEKVEVFSRWEHLTLSLDSWRQGVSEEAGRRMHLS